MYVAGKLSLTAAFNMLYVHTPETMPTELRALGFSVPSTAARVGSFVAVYVALLVSSAVFVFLQFFIRNVCRLH